jgi:geranylgeranyl diphosphate synthase, type I
MSSDGNLMDQVNALMVERSTKPMEKARQAVLKEQLRDEQLQEAVRYFMEEIWCSASHPTLLSLTCEAVGGNPEDTVDIGAAFAVLAGAADIHDDVIDQSRIKDSKPTVFSKFGPDIAIVAGDILWFKGMLMLIEACEPFSVEKKKEILILTKEGFFNIASAEAKEIHCKRNVDLRPEEYFDIIKSKVSVAFAAAKIGAIIGGGNVDQIESLGCYGQCLGVLMTIRDEFIDMFENDELRNRYMNECLPLPMLYAFKDHLIKEEVLALLKIDVLSEIQVEKIVELVTASINLSRLRKEMSALLHEGFRCLSLVEGKNTGLNRLLESSVIGLPI